MSAPIDELRRWADTLPPLSDELREIACEMGDADPNDAGSHFFWPVFATLFRAETGAEPNPRALSIFCDCPEHF